MNGLIENRIISSDITLDDVEPLEPEDYQRMIEEDMVFIVGKTDKEIEMMCRESILENIKNAKDTTI